MLRDSAALQEYIAASKVLALAGSTVSPLSIYCNFAAHAASTDKAALVSTPQSSAGGSTAERKGVPSCMLSAIKGVLAHCCTLHVDW